MQAEKKREESPYRDTLWIVSSESNQKIFNRFERANHGPTAHKWKVMPIRKCSPPHKLALRGHPKSTQLNEAHNFTKQLTMLSDANLQCKFCTFLTQQFRVPKELLGEMLGEILSPNYAQAQCRNKWTSIRRD